MNGRMKLILLAVVALTISATAFVILLLTPIRWYLMTDRAIQTMILKKTPPGTDLQTCIRYIRSELLFGSKDSVDISQSGALAAGEHSKIIGTKSINILLVRQKLPWSSFFYSTYVSFAFDNQDRLLGVIVQKETEGL